jgi:hypothetical protein
MEAMFFSSAKGRLSVVFHTCNSSYSAGGDQKEYGTRLAQGKKVRPYLNSK